MIDKIVEYLNTSGIMAVQFGSGSLPAPPYVCVKGERLAQGRGVRFIAHESKDNQNNLEDLLRNVCEMVTDKQFTSRAGCVNQLGNMLDYLDVAVVSDDETISMEALFLMPSKSI